MNSARARVLAHGALLSVAMVLAACSGKGKTHEPSKLVAIPKPELTLHEQWSHGVGDGSGSQVTGLRIALAEDGVYVASLDGRVDALRAEDGHLLWRTKTHARIAAGPAVGGDQVIVGTLDAQVIDLQRADGKQRWRADAPSEVLAPPAIAGETVVIRAVDSHVYGLDASTGARRWAFDRTEPNLTLRGLSAPLIVGRQIYTGLDNGHLVCLALGDGELQWEQTISESTGRTELERLTDIDADLLAAADGIFVVTYGSDLALISPITGQAVWRRTVKSYSGMAYGNNMLFVTDDDGVLYAFDVESGAQVWKQEGLKYRRLSAPAYFQGEVVVGDAQGYLHWLAPGDGHFVARNRHSHHAIAAPLVAGTQLLYVMDVAGNLGAYRAEVRSTTH